MANHIFNVKLHSQQSYATSDKAWTAIKEVNSNFSESIFVPFQPLLSQNCPNLPKTDSTNFNHYRFAEKYPMSKLVDLQDWLQQNEKVEKQESKLFLTEKELRAFPKYKNASNEEVQEAIQTFHRLALICYHAFCKEEQIQELTKAA